MMRTMRLRHVLAALGGILVGSLSAWPWAILFGLIAGVLIASLASLLDRLKKAPRA